MSIEKNTFETTAESRFSEEEKESLIRGSGSFFELYGILRTIDSVQGSNEVFTPDRLIEIIESVRKGEKTLEHITRTYGLRDAVERLLSKLDIPDVPPHLEAKVALALPLPDSEETLSGDFLENYPVEPIAPLTREEKDSYLKEQEEYDERRWLCVKDPVADERLFSLERKVTRYESVVEPISFDDLMRALADSSFVDGGEIFDGEELRKDVVAVRLGEKKVEDLPRSMQEGVYKLISQDVFERIASGKKNIPNHDWQAFLHARPVVEDYLGRRDYYSVGYPRIGSNEVRTKDAVIDGTLVWADEKNAIFECYGEYRLFPVGEFLMDNGMTKNEEDEQDRIRRGGELKYKQMPY